MVGGEGLRIEGLVPIEYVGHGLGHVQADHDVDHGQVDYGLGHVQADPSQVEHGQVSLLCSIAHSADHLDQSLFTAA